MHSLAWADFCRSQWFFFFSCLWISQVTQYIYIQSVRSRLFTTNLQLLFCVHVFKNKNVRVQSSSLEACPLHSICIHSSCLLALHFFCHVEPHLEGSIILQKGSGWKFFEENISSELNHISYSNWLWCWSAGTSSVLVIGQKRCLISK